MRKDLNYKKIPLVRLEGNRKEKITDFIVQESELKIIFNKRKVASLKYSRRDSEYLAVGFLFTEGFLKKKEEIVSLQFDQEKETIKVITKDIYPFSESGKRDNLSLKKIEKGILQVKAETIFSLLQEWQFRARLFSLTGGAHSCALADQKGSILLFSEDIGRYNTVDKIIGEALLKEISLEDKIMIGSFRITKEIFAKIARGKIPLVVSRSAPTDQAVKLARKMGITLVGFAREGRMNIYSYPERIEV